MGVYENRERPNQCSLQSTREHKRSMQQRPKAGLHKMMIMRQSFLNPLLFHNQKAGAIRKAPILVRHSR